MPRVQQKRGTAANLTAVDPTPLAGELLVVTDENTLVIGNGSDAYTSLAYVTATPRSHTHPASEVTGLATVATTGAYADLSGIPSEFTPASHTHAIADVTNLQSTLDGKAASSHTHVVADVTGLQTALDAKASTSHTHSISDVAGLQTALDGKAASSHAHAAGDVTSGTFAIARIPTGTTSSTVCIGNDARLSDARSPTSHTHGNITNAGAIGSTANLPLITTTSGVITVGAFGTAANTFCQGNDARLSDARTPVAHVHGGADITSGTVAYARLPVGSTASTVCAGDDTRLSDARTPTSHTHTFGQISDIVGLGDPLADNSIVRYTAGVGWGVANAIGTIGVGSQPIGGWPSGSIGAALAGKASTSHVHAASDVTSGTFDIARIPTGTTSSTVCIGNDARLSNARTPTSHTHGNITNAGAIGSTANLPLITTTSGVITVGSFGTAANTFCQGNDARLSNARTPTSHAHGNISNTGTLGSTSGVPLITGTSGIIQAGSFGTAAGTFCQGNDSRLSNTRTPTDNTVSTAKIVNDAVTYAKIQNVSATDRILGRSSAGAGDVQEITCTAFGRSLIDDADAAAARSTLGLSYASQSEVNGTHTTGSVTSGQTSLTVASATGINAGDVVVGEGITPGTTVSSISGTTVTLSANAGATLSSDPVSFYRTDRSLTPGSTAGALCRAWVNFNGTDTVAIRAAYNVSSITDNGTGHYTVNFTEAMPDNKYATLCTSLAASTIARNFSTGIGPEETYLSGSVQIFCETSDGAPIDHSTFCVAVFR